MEYIPLILASSALAALVTFLGNLAMYKTKRRDEKNDTSCTEKREIVAKLEEIGKKLDAHIVSDELETVKSCRTRILIFNDECRRGIKHSEERFNNILEDVDFYEQYCDTHPMFPNSKAVAAIVHIREIYSKCISGEESFL